MKPLVYVHQAMRPILAEITAWLYRVVAGRLLTPKSAGRRRLPWRRLLMVVAVVATLLIEATMLWLLATIIDLCISLMELWAELAAKHLSITLDRTQ